MTNVSRAQTLSFQSFVKTAGPLPQPETYKPNSDDKPTPEPSFHRRHSSGSCCEVVSLFDVDNLSACSSSYSSSHSVASEPVILDLEPLQVERQIEDAKRQSGRPKSLCYSPEPVLHFRRKSYTVLPPTVYTPAQYKGPKYGTVGLFNGDVPVQRFPAPPISRNAQTPGHDQLSFKPDVSSSQQKARVALGIDPPKNQGRGQKSDSHDLKSRLRNLAEHHRPRLPALTIPRKQSTSHEHPSSRSTDPSPRSKNTFQATKHLASPLEDDYEDQVTDAKHLATQYHALLAEQHHSEHHTRRQSRVHRLFTNPSGWAERRESLRFSTLREKVKAHVAGRTPFRGGGRKPSTGSSSGSNYSRSRSPSPPRFTSPFKSAAMRKLSRDAGRQHQAPPPPPPPPAVTKTKRRNSQKRRDSLKASIRVVGVTDPTCV